jgi:molecular chaperone HscC
MSLVGIDLGSTTSLVAVMDGDTPRVLADEHGEETTPSVVAVAEDGTALVGRPAAELHAMRSERGVAGFKRDLGKSVTYRLGGRVLGPVECAARVLAEMRRIAELRLDRSVHRAVFSVPACFHDRQRRAVRAAAALARLEVECLVEEPLAAALALGPGRIGVESTVLVIDLGGGCLDIVVLRCREGAFELLAAAGTCRLGGEDFTAALLKRLEREQRAFVSEGPRGVLRRSLEEAKRRLTWDPEVEVEHGDRRVRIPAEAFVRATSGLTARLGRILRRFLRDAGLHAAELDDVLLVGGATRMGVVQNLLADVLGRFGVARADPLKAVAMGAAVQAALRS